MFHGERGYVSDVDEALVFTLDAAQKEVDSGSLRNGTTQELFLSADHVEDLSILKVDCQLIKLKYPESKDENDEYVVYRKGYWDGNNLAFATEDHNSFDYTKALIFNEQELKDMCSDVWVAVPKSHTDQIARRNFQEKDINRRKMISSAGIVGIRKSRKKQSSGKSRWNCPTCGKIVWQYNPHEFMSCSDKYCDDYDGYLAAAF
ncbi:hypothetical protein [Vibrio sp. D431a]|uniref:hypothetical protein n=1 Tax=Vibrio sp. D431a TaxID=2837388 RepID=UPI0025523D48|nr:hypothetical protein [Vibrio sp. D431a]MDK9789838.1 hypothetical protein [Vibrio sp. D431a]